MSRAVPRRLERPLIALGVATGAVLLVLWRALGATPRMSRVAFLRELHRFAVGAFPMVGTAGLLSGMVMALSTAGQLGRFGLLSRVPDVTAIFVTRELAPVFTALLMAGRAGAGLASELGLVTLSGQAAAMRALGLDLERELLAPRLCAVVFATLLLTVAATLLGLLGGFLFGTAALRLPSAEFTARLAASLAPAHVVMGLVKALVFGLVIALSGLLAGLSDKQDAAALGTDTMKAVVRASFSVLVLDHLLTTLMDGVLS